MGCGGRVLSCGGIFAGRPSLDHYGYRLLLRRRLLLRCVGIVVDAHVHREGVDVGRGDAGAAAERRVAPEGRLFEVGLDPRAALHGLRRKFDFPRWVWTPAPPYMGCASAPPGRTTLPKLRVMPEEVPAVPPGKTTLPKLRWTAWPNTPVASASGRTTASAFMANPP